MRAPTEDTGSWGINSPHAFFSLMKQMFSGCFLGAEHRASASNRRLLSHAGRWRGCLFFTQRTFQAGCLAQGKQKQPGNLKPLRASVSPSLQ